MAFETLTFKAVERASSKEAQPYTPEFVGFSEGEKKWLQGLVGAFGLPLNNIVRFRKTTLAELQKMGIRGLENRPAFWDPVAREVVLIEPERYVEHQLRDMLYHEISHGVLDPFSYIEIDLVKLEPVMENGAPKFRPEVMQVFKTPNNVFRFVKFMEFSVSVALETGVYVNRYQKMVGEKYLALQGDIDLLVRKASNPKLTEDERIKINQEIEEKKRDSRTSLSALFGETWAIVMEMVYVNPNGLKQKSDAQQKEWERQAIEGQYQSVYEEAQYFLRLFYNTDDAGVEQKRLASKQYVEKNAYPKPVI